MKVSFKQRLEHQRWNKTQDVIVIFLKKEKSSALMIHPEVFISTISKVLAFALKYSRKKNRREGKQLKRFSKCCNY